MALLWISLFPWKTPGQKQMGSQESRLLQDIKWPSKWLFCVCQSPGKAEPLLGSSSSLNWGRCPCSPTLRTSLHLMTSSWVCFFLCFSPFWKRKDTVLAWSQFFLLSKILRRLECWWNSWQGSISVSSSLSGTVHCLPTTPKPQLQRHMKY